MSEGTPTLSELPSWFADITFGEALLFLAGIGAIVAVWTKVVLPPLRALTNFLEDWNGEASRPGHPGRTGVMETLFSHGTAISEIKDQIEKVQSQVTPNHGSELKLSEEVQQLRAEVREASAKMQTTQDSLDTHLEGVPTIVADLLEKAGENALELVLAIKGGANQPTLFDDDDPPSPYLIRPSQEPK